MVAPIFKRPLRFWEQICSNMGVTMGFQLEGKVTPAIIKDAYSALKKEYPYLRTVLRQDMNQLSFVEQPTVWPATRSPCPLSPDKGRILAWRNVIDR
jgi:hypothetical protein